ncbi:MAG: peroxidase-related enzyme [Gammaproteobacteria bacterium]|nr:peroxidase-related enzyme [Gammaproteobacteria bacterium]
MTAWIKMLSDEEASDSVKAMFDLARTPSGTVDNVMRVHSLRPHTMKGHVTLYRSVLHNEDNTLPFWFLEVVASYTSFLNKCDYSFSHHFTNARRLMDDDDRSDAIYASFEARAPEQVFSGKELALLQYTERLTIHVAEMNEADFRNLKDAGCDDGEILEVNQVIAYFSYSNRLLNGLGVTTEGDTIGYYKEQHKE